MTHPHVLYAQAALWSLARSWPLLRNAAAQASLDAADGIRSSVYGTRHATGGTPGGADLALATADLERERWARLAERVLDDVIQACWLIRSSAPATLAGGGPLAYVLRGLTVAPPATARDIGQYLRDADHAIRRALGIAEDRQDLPGVDCPSCGTRLLRALTAAPQREHWTVVCGAGCRCSGKGCGCGGVQAYGVAHIWPWTHVVGDRAAA